MLQKTEQRSCQLTVASALRATRPKWWYIREVSVAGCSSIPGLPWRLRQ